MFTHKKNIKSKCFVILIIGFLILSSFSLITLSKKEINNNFNVEYLFEKPTIKKVTVGDKTYDSISMKDITCFGNPGEPLLPIKGTNILLPANSKVKKISIIPGEKIFLGKNYKIEPTGYPTPISKTQKLILSSPNKEIYSSSEPFPNELFSKVGTYKFRGYDILILDLYPVQYIPSSGELYYYLSFTICVETEDFVKNNIMLRHIKKDETAIINKVDNPILKQTYKSVLNNKNNEFYDLLVLTTDSLLDGFIPLKQTHDERGISTRIISIEDESYFSQPATAETIRDFIRQEYISSGIEYVLIGGDLNVVPAKLLYVLGMDEETWPYETIMPSDLYYACLDGPYNFDGDDLWGEPEDGENGEDVDLIAEVYVGRASVGNIDEVNNFVSKTISYINTDYDNEYLKEVIMLGEKLGDYGEYSWGAIYLDPLIDGSSIDGYSTVGIPSDNYNINTIYERDGSWSKSEITNLINEGLHILNHDGHSSYQYNMKMIPDDISLFENDEYFFDYSVGCNSGGFDVEDCFAEYLNVKTQNGAFAVIMNARYGFFWAYRTDGDSTRFTREFWDAVFGEKIPVISKANQDSKEDNLHIIGRSCIRWCYYQLNLFGDPTVAFYINANPEKPSSPVGPTTGIIDKEYSYSTISTDPDNQNLWYKFNWGDGTESAWLGPFKSGEQCNTTHSWSINNEYVVKVKVKDEDGMESGWSESIIVKIEDYDLKEGIWFVRGVFEYLDEDSDFIYINIIQGKLTKFINGIQKTDLESTKIKLGKPFLGLLIKNSKSMPGVGICNKWGYSE